MINDVSHDRVCLASPGAPYAESVTISKAVQDACAWEY
jgi:hypothetical protein